MPSTCPRIQRFPLWFLAAGLLVIMPVLPAFGQSCTEQPPLQNYTGGGASICPCFAAGEEAGVVLTAPAANYPLEILRVGIAWASQFGTSGQTLEDAIHIRQGGLPTPGAILFTLPGPVLQDGAINEWNLEPLAGEITVPSGSFTVSLEFIADNAGDFFAPSVMTDGNGCQPTKNVIFANPGTWMDGCSAGLSGDWVMYAIYRKVCQSGVGDEGIIASAPAFLGAPSPNPFMRSTDLEFFLATPGRATIEVYDLKGARVAGLLDQEMAAGRHDLQWDGRDDKGLEVPSGIYFMKLGTGAFQTSRKVIVAR